jgi:hypothetical protein
VKIAMPRACWEAVSARARLGAMATGSFFRRGKYCEALYRLIRSYFGVGPPPPAPPLQRSGARLFSHDENANLGRAGIWGAGTAVERLHPQRAAAEFFFPHQQAIGRYISKKVSDDFRQAIECQVIGLAEDAKFYDVRQGPPRTIYLPLSTERMDKDLGKLLFLVHSQRKAQAVSAFRQALSEIAPMVPLMIFVTMREQMDAALGSQELITLLANFFGVVALLLSALGLSTDCYRRA